MFVSGNRLIEPGSFSPLFPLNPEPLHPQHKSYDEVLELELELEEMVMRKGRIAEHAGYEHQQAPKAQELSERIEFFDFKASGRKRDPAPVMAAERDHAAVAGFGIDGQASLCPS